jgi:hypothetical protein
MLSVQEQHCHGRWRRLGAQHAGRERKEGEHMRPIKMIGEYSQMPIRVIVWGLTSCPVSFS